MNKKGIYHRLGIYKKREKEYICVRKDTTKKMTKHIITALIIIYSLANQTIAQEVEKDTTIEQVVITARRAGTSMSKYSINKTESINASGLRKMACCSLAESFENSASASISYADAVSGARSIQLLGLASRYTQVTNENMPAMHGLAATYGWNYVPSTWLESIQISKGASSVVGGYESIAGQINMEFRNPNLHETVYADIYADDMMHAEANAAIKLELNDKLWTNILLHTTQTPTPSNLAKQHDKNEDEFLDSPLDKNYSLSNRWLYIGESGVQIRSGIMVTYDDLKGGQDEACHEQVEGIPLYESPIRNFHLNIYNKTGFAVGESGSIGIINTYTHSDVEANIGLKSHEGDEDYYYGSAVYTSAFDADERHKYTCGINITADRYRASYMDMLPDNRNEEFETSYKEIVAGALFEYTFSPIDKFTLIAGLRADHNSRYGMLITPRANARYAPFEWLVLRANVGRGFRSVQPLTESMRMMASSRRFDTENINNIDIEKAWNFGGNIAFTIPIWDNRKATLSIDYYHTKFDEQLIIDTERSRHEVHIYNLGEGTSYADVFQADLSVTLRDRLELFAAIRTNRSHQTYHDEDKQYKCETPLISTLRGLINLEYATRMRKWVFNTTYQVNGKMRLPYMNGYESEDIYSPVYPVLFFQATKNWRRAELYAGVENILDYKQDDPIRSWQNPYSEEFDASMIWGPVEGRKIYFGLRLHIGEL